nr:PREDICTED: putative neutral sphingomyelinase [Bemisia tabaci]XP_018898927.1 PREDICTED: putative neutral sphingomyelinase [Bemisia tabaci]XP_018898928.1 PREDICTED: putative neutral sphingomyelinase [Bemisia tabaci]XP_018898929.1 PREDICTED: putative neutral sphingomyelinase [Bemisia tabaci]
MTTCDQLSSKDSNSTTITIFSLNCWGIFLLSKDRVPRMQAIAAHLVEKKYDFVCLQEVWVEDDFQLIKEETQNILPYSQYFYSGFVGSGVCIFSRWPIKEVLFHQWQLNGYFHKVMHADFFGGKGIAFIQCVIKGIKINIYSVHLHAEYSTHSDEYLCHRIIQAFDLSQFIRITSQNADLAILAGDLNSQPSQLSYQLILTNSNMCDASEQANESELGTFNHTRNSYRNLKYQVDQKIDHILYKICSPHKVQFLSYAQPLSDLVSNESFSHSDHEAITATFRLSQPSGDFSDSFVEEENKLQHEYLEEAIMICESALRKLNKDKAWYYGAVTVIFIALLLVYQTELPFTYIKVFNSLLFISAVFIIFFGFMALFWTTMESNGIKSGYHCMKIAASRTEKKHLS